MILHITNMHKNYAKQNMHKNMHRKIHIKALHKNMNTEAYLFVVPMEH